SDTLDGDSLRFPAALTAPFLTEEEESDMECFGKCLFWFVFFFQFAEWPSRLDPLVFLLPYSTVYPTECLKLKARWFDFIAGPTVPLLREAEKVLQNPAAIEGKEGVCTLLRLLPPWANALQPGALGESLADCLSLLNEAISKEESSQSNTDLPYITQAVKVIYRTLIENIVLYKRCDTVKALSRGLNVTGIFRLLQQQ